MKQISLLKAMYLTHNELCPCGNNRPWLTLEGRTDDISHNGVTCEIHLSDKMPEVNVHSGKFKHIIAMK